MNINFIKFFRQKENWLISLFALLYFLFPTAILFSNIILFFIILIGLFGFNRDVYWSIFKNTPDILAMSALYAFILFGIFYSSASNDWILLHLGKYAKFLYSVVLIILLSGQPKLQRVAFNAFIAAMFFILLSTWLNVWFLLPWSVTQNLGWGKSHHVFGDYITQNLMMVFFSVIAMQKFFYTYTGIRKMLWGVTGILAIMSISHLSQGRTGLVLLAVGLLAFAISATRGKVLLGAVIGVILIIGLTFWTSSLMQDRFSMMMADAQRYDIEKTTSIGHRLYNYKITPELIFEKPLLGHGTGAYHAEICRFVEPKDLCPIFNWHPHNQYLLFGADHGVFGIFLYLFLMLTLYRTALKSENFESKHLLFSLVSMLFIGSLFNSPLYSSRESEFFIYLISLLVCMCKPVRAEVN